MPDHQQRAGGDDHQCVLQEARDRAVAHPQASHHPRDGAQQNGVDDQVGEARAAADDDLIDHRAVHGLQHYSPASRSGCRMMRAPPLRGCGAGAGESAGAGEVAGEAPFWCATCGAGAGSSKSKVSILRPREAIFSDEVRIFSISVLAWPKWRWRSNTRSRKRPMSSISLATSAWIKWACSRICTSLRIDCMVCTASISIFGAQITMRARCAFCTMSEKCSAKSP